jgi:hypothetical protein
MKNPSRAVCKAAKSSSLAPVEKRNDHAPLPLKRDLPSPLAVLAADPFGSRECFEIVLDWIGNTMEPEIYQGNWAMVTKRDNMRPCLTEMVLGLLKNGQLVFGAFNCSEKGELLRIDFINPANASVFYRESDFQWLYPVECISQLDKTQKYRRIMKSIEFTRGDDEDCVAHPERLGLVLPSKSR